MVLGVDVGEDRVELREAFPRLEGLGSALVLVDGGPRPNPQLVDDGLLDELCLTLAPRLVAGDYPPGLAGGELPEPLELETVQLLEEGGLYFYGFGRAAAAGNTRPLLPGRLRRFLSAPRV
jgi:riboflavin biosynthesis pyrimidine reductase